MNAYIKVLEDAQMNKAIPDFRTGDTLLIQIKIRETSGEGNKKNTRERLQRFEGVVLGRKNKGLNSSVTLHRVIEGESVTLVVPLYSPLIANIEVKRRGDVRKAKIYYLSELRGKAARIKERYVNKKAISTIPDESIPATETSIAPEEDTPPPEESMAYATENTASLADAESVPRQSLELITENVAGE